MKRVYKRWILRLLPQVQAYRWLVGDLVRRRRAAGVSAIDYEPSTPREGLRVDTYWADVPGVGSGPTVALFVHEIEVLRADCFGGSEGHMHLNPDEFRVLPNRVATRLFFPPGDRKSHVERAVFEVRANFQYALLTSALPEIREFEVTDAELDAVADQVEGRLCQLLQERG